MLRLASRVLFFVGVSLALGLGASCANNGAQPGGDAGSDASVVGPCGPGSAVMCGDTCVDTQSDFQNCGACGKACPADQVCSHGSCAVVCGGGTSRCGNDCIDTKSDVNHCGGCNTPCPSGQVCSNASCAPTCQASLTNCNGDCVDTTQNDDNCGSCGAPCASGQVCQNSQCVATCQAGWSTCPVGDAGATTCVDTRYDVNHCGACDTPCPSGELCSPVNNVGTCSLSCGGGTTKCGSACVDENIDPNHCGDCGTQCSGGTPSCSSGHCCPNGDVYCNGACDTLSNCILNGGGSLSAGGQHVCAITPGGVLKCWGSNDAGQIGNNDPGNPALSAASVLGLSNVTGVGAGTDYTCATAGGSAYCWGDPYDGELGDGDPNTELDQPSVTPISLGGTPLSVDGGYDQGCALLSGGTLECWGDNASGDVGDGTGTEQDSPVSITLAKSALAVAAGTGTFTCAVLSDGTAMCWGSDGEGQCGDNTTTFDDNLSPVAVQGLTSIASISLGNNHACAVRTNGDVWCWGDDEYGELGDGGSTYSAVPVQASGVSGALAVATGGDGFFYAHTCALLQSGSVVCWGSNDNGQLGDGTTNPSTTPVTALSSGAVAIAAGSDFTCAYKNDGTVWCWGYNGDGELGDGTGVDSSSPVQVAGF